MAAAVAVVKLALSLEVRTAGKAPASSATMQDLPVPEYLRRLYIAYLHAQGQNSQRFALNMQLLKVAHTLRTRHGFSTAQVNRMTREARLQARHDFGTEADVEARWPVGMMMAPPSAGLCADQQWLVAPKTSNNSSNTA
jgi:hypothetical protein